MTQRIDAAKAPDNAGRRSARRPWRAPEFHMIDVDLTQAGGKNSIDGGGHHS